MKIIDLFQVDAFADKIFGGNPAAVCPLSEWLSDEMLQAITIEHNQSETAFFVPRADGFELRWFTTANGEIDLCGHATLASAHVIFEHLMYPQPEIKFTTRFSGPLFVRRQAGWLTLNFPAWMPETVTFPEGILAGLGGQQPLECHKKRDFLFVYDNEDVVRNMRPDFKILGQLKDRVCITAPGKDCDFVSRFFCPGDALEEDPVTGSAHSMLIPYWAKRTGKSKFHAKQLSTRGGELRCEFLGERVLIGGQARTYSRGQIFLPD